MGRFTEKLSKAKIRRVEGTWSGYAPSFVDDGYHIDDGYEEESDECFECKCAAIKAETEAAVLLLIEGEEHWVPKSQLLYADVEEGVARMSHWIAGQLGIE